MNPGKWSPGPNPTEAEVRAFAGADLDPSAFHVSPSQAVTLLQKCLRPSELEMIVFQSQPYYLARDQRSQLRLVRGQGDWSSCLLAMPAQELLQAGSRVADNAAPAESAMLDRYDAYYYDRDRQKPLPILRVRFADARQTWLYINPQTALIQARYTNRSRYERWLYQGLHDLDFPFLYWHRPAWDLTVIALSVGGIALIFTSIVLAVKYLQKSAKRNLRIGSVTHPKVPVSRNIPGAI